MVANPIDVVSGSGIIDQGAQIAALAAGQLGQNAASAGFLQPGQIGAGGTSFIPTLGRDVAEEQSLAERARLAEQADDLSPFCYCGAGYYKNIWEIILQKPVEVTLTKSVLRGDDVCRVEVHLPAG